MRKTGPAKIGAVRPFLLALSSGPAITRPAGLVPRSMKADISSLEYSVGHHKPPYEPLLITLLKLTYQKNIFTIRFSMIFCTR